jgi:SAM-dependent methyltransferase
LGVGRVYRADTVDARTRRSKFYDGAVYGRLVEPMLDGVHGFVVEKLPAGHRVLEACCGTGGLARRIAARGRQVHAVDLSPANVAYAQRTHDGVTFEAADVATLSVPPEGPYDVATTVLALHEMPAEARGPVLANLLDISRTVMVVDFAVPMPWNLSGARNRTMEVLAGLEHYRAFVDFYRRGGLDPLVAECRATLQSRRRIDGGTLEVLVLRGRP